MTRLTHYEIEREIAALKCDPDVKIAQAQARQRQKRMRYLYQLRSLKKKGAALRNPDGSINSELFWKGVMQDVDRADEE